MGKSSQVSLIKIFQAIMSFWTYSYQHAPHEQEVEMDKEFLLDLRELRCLLDKEKEIKQ